MLKIKSKYKIAKRLGAPIFEKCQTQKFTLSQSKIENRVGKKRRKQKTGYGLQLIEKQKARYTYVISEKQFSGYVKKAISSKEMGPAEKLFELLELRLDNVIYKLGFAKTRMMARQIVSHGHIVVNGRKLNIPSYQTKEGDKVSIRKESRDKEVFKNLIFAGIVPEWLSFKNKEVEGTLKGRPIYKVGENLFDLHTVIEFYNR